MSSFTGTTGELSRGGGKGAAPTGPPTMFSDASSSFWRIVAEWYIQGTYQARRTQRTPHLEASTLPVPSYSAQSPSLAKRGPSSSMSDPGELAKLAAVKCLVRARENDVIPADIATPALKQQKVSEARPRHIPIPPASAPSARGTAPYPQHLTPNPSVLHPHCLAKDQLRMWTPVLPATEPADTSARNKAEQEQVKEIMIHAWEEDTHVVYGAGLLMWHCFCDEKGILEEVRAPVTQDLVSVFVAHLAAAYSGRTISGYLNGVRAWHILHGLSWSLDKQKMEAILRAADKLTPASSKRKK